MPKLRAALAVLFLGVSALVALAFAPNPDPDVDKDAATVIVSDAGGHGSGVFIAPHLVLTAAHVVSDAGPDETILITDHDGGRAGARVVWMDKTLDLAVLGVRNHRAPAVAGIACYEPAVGAGVEVVGNPLSATWVHSWGRVSGRRITAAPGSDAAQREDRGGRTYFLTDAAATWGNSGGPVFDAGGRVVGILVEMVARPLGFGGIVPSGFSVAVTGKTLCEALAPAREMNSLHLGG